MKKLTLLLIIFLSLCNSCADFNPDFSYIQNNDIDILSYLEVNDGLVDYGFDTVLSTNTILKESYIAIIVDAYLIEDSITLEKMEYLYNYLDSSYNIMIVFGNITTENKDKMHPFKFYNISEEQIIIFSNFYTSGYSMSFLDNHVDSQHAFAYSSLQGIIKYIKEYKISL